MSVKLISDKKSYRSTMEGIINGAFYIFSVLILLLVTSKFL